MRFPVARTRPLPVLTRAGQVVAGGQGGRVVGAQYPLAAARDEAMVKARRGECINRNTITVGDYLSGTGHKPLRQRPLQPRTVSY